MVNLNELRRGNYVKDAIYMMRKIIKVSEITPDHILHEGDESEEPFADDEIDGIPLTPEILEKCGFKRDEDGVYFLSKCLYWLDGGVLQIALGRAPLINAPCKYLHQLQNIIFSLRGTELEINLTEKA